MIFVGITAFFLAHDSPVFVFQLILSVVALCLTIRIFFYLRVPEVERPGPTNDGFVRSLKVLARVPGYAPFCAYVFLLMLFTAGCPTLFGLLEKQILNFGDQVVMWLGVIFMSGNVLGYYLGGLAVDRFGTRTVFVFCHFTFGFVLLLFPLRDFLPGGVLPIMAALNFFFGLVTAASSIAVTTEMMSLLPSAHKSLAVALCLTLLRLGGALSGFMSAWVLKLGILRESWTLWGATLSPYDALLLGSGVMIVLLVVTLGLVPSVIGKAEWMPGHH
jgi:MFS family permease